MAGTTILSGSLTTSDAFHPSLDCLRPRTLDAVLGTVDIRRHAVLLAYSLYSLLMDCDRYKTKFLLPIHDPEGLGHRYQGVGDFAVSDEDGRLYECIQVAPNASISPAFIAEALKKVQTYSPHRFCLLTLGEIDPLDKASLTETTASLSRIYGCEVVVDSLMQTVSARLRFLAEPSDLLAAYAQASQEDQNSLDYPV